MSSTESPMNIAHQHAASAEEHLRNGLWMLAAEEHSKAATSFQAALERSDNESAKRAMRMLFNEHRKAAADLERKISKLKSEGKDPSLPQKPDVSRTSTVSTPASVHHPQQPYLGPSQIPSHSGRNNNMIESHATVDESFMVLAGQQSDPGDAFNQFWNIMQGMMDNLSQPVAFATVPLDSNDGAKRKGKQVQREGSVSSDTDIDEPMVSKISRKLGMSAGSKSSPKQSYSASPLSRTAGGVETSTEEEAFDDDNDLSESFFLIPSAKETMALKRENAALRSEADALRKRLEATEKILQLRKEQDLHLRDSIYMATKEAQRAIGTTGPPPRQLVDHLVQPTASPNPNLPPIPGYHTAREAQYGHRVKELEDELRLVRVDLEKARMENTKYRDRWNKVKESAKRKKELKAAGVSGGGDDKLTPIARERIDEEPEAEELAEAVL